MPDFQEIRQPLIEFVRLVALLLHAIEYVFLDIHMRKQGVVLEHVSHPALAGRNKCFCLGGKQHFSVMGDGSSVGLHQSCYTAQCRRFAAARGAEQHQNVVFQGKLHLQGEILEHLSNIDSQHHCTPRRPVSRVLDLVQRFSQKMREKLMRLIVST